jgi:preprotein translocase subunit SecF
MWKPVRLFTFKRKFDFLVHRRAALIISTLINVVAIVGVFTIGLNFGIDFKATISASPAPSA